MQEDAGKMALSRRDALEAILAFANQGLEVDEPSEGEDVKIFKLWTDLLEMIVKLSELSLKVD